MRKIILYIDSGTFREDYARVYRSIHTELVHTGFRIQTILGPRSTNETATKFKEMSPIQIETIIDQQKMKPRINTLAFFKAVMSKHIPIARRKPWRLISSYIRFSSLVKYIQQYEPTLIISIKYDSCYEFVAAANSLNVKTIAIQHGEPYLGSYPEKRVHEWPASTILVWSNFWLEYHAKTFPRQANYHSIDSILWHARYSKKKNKKSNKIVIYESNIWPERHIENIISSFPPGLVELKPHPYKKEKGLSDVVQNYPQLINSDELWDIVPRLGLSLGSTVTNEILFHGSPCLSISPSSEDIGVSFPVTGSFLVDTDPDDLVALMKQIYSDSEFACDFLSRQVGERQKYCLHGDPAKKIAEFCLNC